MSALDLDCAPTSWASDPLTVLCPAKRSLMAPGRCQALRGSMSACAGCPVAAHADALAKEIAATQERVDYEREDRPRVKPSHCVICREPLEQPSRTLRIAHPGECARQRRLQRQRKWDAAHPREKPNVRATSCSECGAAAGADWTFVRKACRGDCTRARELRMKREAYEREART